MKKIVVLFTVAVAAMTSGCLSNSAQACLKAAECAEEEDPEQFCKDQEADCKDDCATIKEACTAEQDAFAACLVANGTCDEIDGVDGKFFGVEASAADGACETQAKDNADCAAKALE